VNIRSTSSRWREVALTLGVVALVAGCRQDPKRPAPPEPPAIQWPQLAEAGSGRPVRIEAITSQEGKRLVAHAFATNSTRQIIAAIARYSTDGGLDPSFGTGGMRLLEFHAGFDPDSVENRPVLMAVQADGRILVAGTSLDPLAYIRGDPVTDFVVYRLTRDGALDDTFGSGGKVTVDVSKVDQVRGLALSGDGKPVIAGISIDTSYNSRVVLARFNLDGTLDASFGTQGLVTQAADSSGAVHDLVIGTLDGTERLTIGGSVLNCAPVFSRFMPDGQLDPSFGTGGTVRVSVGSSWCNVEDLLLQPDGKAVALGTQDPWVPLLIRLTPQGALDSSFQGGMVRAPSLGPNTFWRALALAPDGTLLTAGFRSTSNGGFLAAAYNPDGTLVTGRGTLLGPASTSGLLLVPGAAGGGSLSAATLAIEEAGGRAQVILGGAQDLRNQSNAITVEIDGAQGLAQVRWVGDSPRGTGESMARAVAVQQDGAMIVVGSAIRGRSRDVVVVRLLPNGAPDPQFGDQGAVFIDNADGDDDGHAVSLLGDGKILVAGCGYREQGSTSALLARLNPDGTLDGSFQGTGVVLFPAAGPDTCAQALEPRPDGKIVIAGFHGRPATPPFFPTAQYSLLVARFNADGTPDQDFNTKAASPLVNGKRTQGRALALHEDGTLTVVANVTSPGDFAVARFQADGTPGAVQTYDVADGSDSVSAVRRMADGSLMLAGAAKMPANATHVLLARLRPDGSLDTGFGGNPRPGLATVDLGQNLGASALWIDSAGRLVTPLISGTAGTASDFAVARFDASGVADPDFGSAGVVRVDFSGRGDFAYGVIERPDGQLLLVGSATAPSGIGSIGLALAPP
jgi:uncharacterized delta-60 repeat protein